MFGQLYLNKLWTYSAIKVAGPICVFLMNFWRDGNDAGAIYGFLANVNYDVVFFAQGLVDSLYWDKQEQHLHSIFKESILGPFLCMASACVVAVTAPTVTQNEGFLWYYPLYHAKFMQHIFTFGGWYWVYYYCFLCSSLINKKYNDEIFNWINGVSLWGYVSHYMWLVLVVAYIIKPFKISLGWAIFLNFFITLFFINLSYWLILKAGQLWKNWRNR